MVVKTYRGLLADGGQQRIRLQTIKGKVGYKIIKFAIMTTNPSEDTWEHIVKVYTEEQTTVDNEINFTDSSLLAVGYISQNYTLRGGFSNYIFDNHIFNQDIYVTQVDEAAGNQACNYYLELEVIPLDDAGAEYTTLKDLRQA